MTIFAHEIRRGRRALLIWSASVGLMLAICLIMYPEMKGQMDGVDQLFASMGGFTVAFGMDKVSFGSLMGFYSVECGSVLSIGGAFFAALLGVAALSREEGGHTAEFLLTHPVSRARVVGAKLAAAAAQIFLFNAVCILCALASLAAIGETPEWKSFWLFHLAELLLQLQILCVCFGLSAFLRRGGAGVGLGLAALLYFLNIFGNISEKADFVKYLTPFAYAEAADIVSACALDWTLIGVGALYAAVGVAAAFLKYGKKDILA